MRAPRSTGITQCIASGQHWVKPIITGDVDSSALRVATELLVTEGEGSVVSGEIWTHRQHWGEREGEREGGGRAGGFGIGNRPF